MSLLGVDVRVQTIGNGCTGPRGFYRTVLRPDTQYRTGLRLATPRVSTRPPVDDSRRRQTRLQFVLFQPTALYPRFHLCRVIVQGVLPKLTHSYLPNPAGITVH
jgi:hypothetical protein